jgi:hypothetical protein
MAGMGRRVFTPGEVLTATNVNGYLMDQSVQVYAGTAARGSAIGTAVSEGMVSYLADTNVVQAYDGAAWNSLAYASAVPTIVQVGLIPMVPTSVDKAGGTATYNSVGQVTFSGNITSLSLNGVFTSNYANYKIIFKGNGTVSGAALYFQYRVAGANAGSNLYYTGGWYARASAGANGYWSQNAGTNLDLCRLDSTSDFRNSFTVEVYDPQAAKVTGHNSLWAGQDSGGILSGFTNGFYAASTQYDGFTIYTSSGNMQGTITVYGYND